MNLDLVNYILKFYNELKTDEEKKILNFFSINEKVLGMKRNNIPNEYIDLFLKEKNIEKDFFDKISKVDSFIFRKRVAERIYRENPEIFINKCPICGTIARTPESNQAPCGHRW